MDREKGGNPQAAACAPWFVTTQPPRHRKAKVMTEIIVEQCDVDRTADYIARAFGHEYGRSVLRERRWPDLIEAFARHRLAEQERAIGVVASDDRLPNFARERIATAIRNRTHAD